jgi:hypothetical protein
MLGSPSVSRSPAMSNLLSSIQEAPRAPAMIMHLIGKFNELFDSLVVCGELAGSQAVAGSLLIR